MVLRKPFPVELEYENVGFKEEGKIGIKGENLLGQGEDPTTRRGGGGWVLPYKRLMGMCRRMGSHFHNWIDYHGVAFSSELRNGAAHFRTSWGKTVLHIYD